MIIDSETGEVLVPFMRTPYNYSMDRASDESGLVCPEPTLTQQQFKDDSDINVMLKRFALTGELPTDVKVPLEGDYTEVVNDYQSALNIVRRADEAFMQFPADVRARFNNDPQRLMEFVENPKNVDEARTLGIAVPKVEVPKPEPMLVRVVPEAPGTVPT